MSYTSPAIVTQMAARRLPRWVLLVLAMAYVIPGWLGRDPWRQADLPAFGAMLDLAKNGSHWLRPEVLGEQAELAGWLPYWLGAAAIRLFSSWPADLAARTPFALLLVLTLVSTWYAMYHLARLPGAQPVSFAFGGEARPVDYARAMADAALMALVASLGLGLLSHESSPSAAQLAFSAVHLYAGARLISAYARWHVFGIAVWWAGSIGLALSGAPGVALALGLGWLGLSAWNRTGNTHGTRRLWMWGFCAVGTLTGAWLTWSLGWPSFTHPLHGTDWLAYPAWRSLGRLLAWFTWPVGLLALWTLWRWHRRWREGQLLLPLWWALVLGIATWWAGGESRVLLLALPALACLAALALPTLSRTVTALIDWFALLFFTGGALILWIVYIAMMTGSPAKPAANVAKLTPGFQPMFAWEVLLPAVLATVAWVGVLWWRIGRHRPALWKSLVLSASGSTLCWLLLMTLWLPLLNHGLGQRPISERIAAVTPAGTCTLVFGLNHSQIAGLQYHGGLDVRRWQTHNATAHADECDRLVLHPAAYHRLLPGQLNDWSLMASIPRLRENRDSLMVFERRN